MSGMMVKLFPLGAVLISVFAYFFPAVLTRFDDLIVPLLGLIMLGMGATLSLNDFQTVFKRPRAVVAGLLLQFTLMPLWAYIIGKALNLPPEQFTGLVITGAVAGGTASNVIAYLAGGDVALSITMTACSTVAGIVLTPLISTLYLQHTVEVPAWAMFKSILLIVALPVSLGLIINRLIKKRKYILEKFCPVLSAVSIVLVIGIIMSLNANTLKECGFKVFLAVILHNLAGLTCGYICALLLKCDRKTAITIAVEVGMQNSGLAAALAKQFFGINAALPGAVFSVWHNISGAIFAAVSKKLKGKELGEEGKNF